MWPWGHAAVAYLLYTLYSRRYRDQPPAGPGAIVVVFAAMLPDLIDKPLAWTYHILPGGRTLGHSIFFAVIVVLIAAWIAGRGHEDVGVALALGNLSHIATDLPSDLVLGNLEGAQYLLWPVLAQPEYETPEGIIAYILASSLDAYGVFQLGLFAFAAIVWYGDGKPGLATVRHTVRRAFNTLPVRGP